MKRWTLLVLASFVCFIPVIGIPLYATFICFYWIPKNAKFLIAMIQGKEKKIGIDLGIDTLLNKEKLI